jgi:hypothetical protein
MGLLVWIIVIIVILAIIGLGWNTFFSGVKKGADKIGITSIVKNAANDAAGIAKDPSREITAGSLSQ